MDTQREIPLLRSSAKVRRGEGRLVIEHLTEEITLEGAAADIFGRMLPHLDGKTGLAAIAAIIAEKPTRVLALARKLRTAGVLSLREAHEQGTDGRAMSGQEFLALHRRYCEHWLQPVYEHPFWQKVCEGKATRAQVLGFAFEKYHYIEGAYEHMAVAASNATPAMMPHLARHFIEEYTHGDIYRKGLQSLFPNDVILTAQPLPSTRALVNFLSESAGRSSFAYYAGNEVLQMTENTGDETAGGAVNQFYQAMRAHYPYTERLIASFVAHTHADQNLGHDGVFQEMCASIPPLSLAEVQDALNTARSMAEHLWLFVDGIDGFYARFPAVPRTPCTVHSE